MNSIGLMLDSAWRVLLAALILGAGLPAIFGVGVRMLAVGHGGDAEVDHAKPKPIGTVLAYVCFAIVLLAVVLGITYIVASGMGKTLSFEHIFPTIVDKK